MFLSRVRMFCFVILSVCASSAYADTLKLSHQWPVSDGRAVAAQRFAKDVMKQDPSLKFRIYPGASLISNPIGQLGALQRGTIDLSVYPLVYGVGKIPELSVTILPGLVRSISDATNLRESEFGRRLQALSENNGFHILAWWWMEGGIANTNRPITDPASVDGLKMRGADVTIDTMLRSAGANVISMPSTELYSALQSGVLDGLLTTYDSLVSMRLYEQTNYATMGGDHTIFVLLNPLIISKEAWDKLSESQRDIMNKEARASEKRFLKQQTAFKSEAVARYKKAGVKVHPMTEKSYRAWLRLAQSTSWKKYAQLSPIARQLIEALKQAQQ